MATRRPIRDHLFEDAGTKKGRCQKRDDEGGGDDKGKVRIACDMPLRIRAQPPLAVRATAQTRARPKQELTLLRAARAQAALAGKKHVKPHHLAEVATMALRHRLRRNVLDDTGSTARITRAIAELIPA